MRNNYSVKVAESSKQLTAREKLMFSDTSNASKLDDVVEIGSTVVLTPVDYAVLTVHNESSENKDYVVYVIVDKSGEKYVTGSTSFWNSFYDIWDVMHDSIADGDIEEYQIEVYKKESKNYKGKYFLTCSVI